jgi:ABC-type uncharacterized transport system permease subunit
MQGAAELGWWGVLIAVIGGAIRVSTPYLFVSLGDTLTETCGRVNLGLEGVLLTAPALVALYLQHVVAPFELGPLYRVVALGPADLGRLNFTPAPAAQPNSL